MTSPQASVRAAAGPAPTTVAPATSSATANVLGTARGRRRDRIVVPVEDDGEGDITPPCGCVPGRARTGTGSPSPRAEPLAVEGETGPYARGGRRTSLDELVGTSAHEHFEGLRIPRTQSHVCATAQKIASAREKGAGRCRRPRRRPLTGRHRSSQRWRPIPGTLSPALSPIPHRVLAHPGSCSSPAPKHQPGLSSRPPSGTPRPYVSRASSTATAPVVVLVDLRQVSLRRHCCGRAVCRRGARRR